MAEDDEYELLPRQEVENLKKAIERLRKNPLGELKEGESLLESINNLNTNIRRLIDIFTKAEADIAMQYTDNSPLETLSSIKDQNEQLAQGLVAVADMVKDLKEDVAQSTQPVRTSPGPKVAMVRPSFESAFDTFPKQMSKLPDDFSQQIPPPPQPFQEPGTNQMPPFDENFDKKRRFLDRK